MNLIKVILLLFLVLKSACEFTMPMMSCCETTPITEKVADTSDNEDDDDCCGGFNCECLCCSHIFTIDDNSELYVAIATYPKVINAIYIDRLSRIYCNDSWQPPQYS